MRKALVMLCAAALGACSAGTQESVATASTKAVIASDEGYTAASRLGASLVAAGTVDKPTYQMLDGQAYAALVLLRAAQATGTAADVAAANTQLQAAIAALNALKGK